MNTRWYRYVLIVVNNCCGCIARYGHCKLYLVAGAFPFGSDQPLRAAVGPFHPAEPLYKMRLDHYMFKPGILLIVMNPGKCIHHPGTYIAQEYMIYRCIPEVR